MCHANILKETSSLLNRRKRSMRPLIRIYTVYTPVEKLTYDKNSSSRLKITKGHETELKWIKLLQTLFPLGFNDIL